MMGQCQGLRSDAGDTADPATTSSHPWDMGEMLGARSTGSERPAQQAAPTLETHAHMQYYAQACLCP